MSGAVVTRKDGSEELSREVMAPFSQSANNSTPTLTIRDSEERLGEKTSETQTPNNMSDPVLGNKDSQVQLSPSHARIDSNDFSDVENGAAAQGRPAGPVDEAEKNFQPKSTKFWLIMLSNFVAMFLVALDRTIIATAIPRITDDFGSLGDIGWYGSAYMLTTAASQLLFGRIYKFYNLRW
jgi:hypothetical protein